MLALGGVRNGGEKLMGQGMVSRSRGVFRFQAWVVDYCWVC
jgi:hypothetical protein